jgi:hypothetical protein
MPTQATATSHCELGALHDTCLEAASVWIIHMLQKDQKGGRHVKKLPAIVIPLAAAKLASVFGLEMRDLSRNAAAGAAASAGAAAGARVPGMLAELLNGWGSWNNSSFIHLPQWHPYFTAIQLMPPIM